MGIPVVRARQPELLLIKFLALPVLSGVVLQRQIITPPATVGN